MCAVRSGISRAGSRAANTGGGLLARLEQAPDKLMGQVVAPALDGVATPVTALQRQMAPNMPWARSVLRVSGEALGRRHGREALLPQAVTALSGGGVALLRLGLKLVPHGQAIEKAVAVTDAAGSVAARGVNRMTRTTAAGEVVQQRRRLLLFGRKEKVKFWRSRLTPLFNRTDLMTRQVISSQGMVLTARGRAWHLGSSQVSTGRGPQTITHLQSMGVLGLQHYYFNRRLTREEAAGVASGQLAADSVPGYAGQVSRVESLAPAWAHAKHTWLKTRLHWPGQPTAG
ncbi:MAG: hypothetical protein Kow0031_19260 [Anaerolineae bacterium]